MVFLLLLSCGGLIINVMAQKHFISEAALKSIVAECIGKALKSAGPDALLEAYLSEVATLQDIHGKYYRGIPYEDFDIIVHADPTAGPDKMGKYGKWLLSMYLKGKFSPQSFLKVKKYLEAFDKYKSRLSINDINQIRSVDELQSIVTPYLESPNQPASKTQSIKAMKSNGSMKVYEDERWVVIVPFTKDAAIQYGKGTKWCTSAIKNNMFNHYNGFGNLYIMIDKIGKRKYQYHMEQNEFKDEQDKEVENRIPEGATKGLIEFIQHGIEKINSKVIKKKEEYLSQSLTDRLQSGESPESVFGIVGYEVDGLKIISLNGKYNFLTNDNRILSSLWFDDANVFDHGYAKVKITKKGFNLLKKDGTLALKDWAWDIGEFLHGVARFIVLEKGTNYIREDGKILLDKYVYGGSGFYNGYANIRETENSASHTINRDGKIIA